MMLPLQIKLPSIPFCAYTDAARRFFQSKCEAALKSSGKYERKVTQQRRQNRLTRVSVKNLTPPP